MESRKFLKTSATVFAVLAWVSLALQLVVGLAVLVMGGPPVPIGGAEIPARLIGILNFAAAAIYWFLFMFISHMTRALLDVHGKVTGGSS
jgi:hypothetical protein